MPSGRSRFGVGAAGPALFAVLPGAVALAVFRFGGRDLVSLRVTDGSREEVARMIGAPQE